MPRTSTEFIWQSCPRGTTAEREGAPGISREEAVQQFQSHAALLTWPNFIAVFGLTTIEAAACGCPVISRDSRAARELIIHGKTGFVARNLQQAEDLIRSNAVARIKAGDFRHQAKKFSIEASARGHLKMLEDVANGVYW